MADPTRSACSAAGSSRVPNSRLCNSLVRVNLSGRGSRHPFTVTLGLLLKANSGRTASTSGDRPVGGDAAHHPAATGPLDQVRQRVGAKTGHKASNVDLDPVAA